ncbi:uncharacterized protein LOC143288726 [Babylonia areolata]|uniref:uncharacterized protein LOC143288726 n=1 Tax=Babylonia areolata TaxID=304850 RepID=UPI003FD2C004
MKKAVTPKKLVHYVILFTVGWFSYRFYASYQKSTEDTFRPYGPRDLRRGRHDDRGEHSEDAEPVDLEKRLQEIQKEIDRQKHLRSQQHHKDENIRHPGEQDKVEDEGFDDADPGDEKYQRKGAWEAEENEEERGNRNPLGDAKKDLKDADSDDERVDRMVRWKQGRDDAPRGDDERKPLVGDKGKDGPDFEDDARLKKKDAPKEEFQVEQEVDWELEEELQRRRKKYLEQVAERAEPYNPEDYKNVHEADDHLAFVTAGSDRTWGGLLQFIHSIQYFYPDSDIGIFDLGLSREHLEKLKSICRVKIMLTFIKFWPEHLKDFSKNLWRPMVWQMGLSTYGHVVYVEPERFLYAKNMKHYIEHSRRSGITVVGKKLQYSPFVVTHPEMYHFLNVDTRKLQRVSMFDVTMLVMHNSQPVRHELMRHLVSCTLEEYCIAPPGSRAKCDHRFYAGSKKYANCHRYEMSAINILLNKWFGFKPEEFLVRDIATRHYDGTDVSAKLKLCPKEGGGGGEGGHHDRHKEEI